ncbi:9146_t:CDS:2, partial [Dentiscutata erythropus]
CENADREIMIRISNAKKTCKSNVAFNHKFDGDEVLQIDVKLPEDINMDNDNLVMEEFFDIRTFEEQTTTEEGFHPQENTVINEDWSIDDIFRLYKF